MKHSRGFGVLLSYINKFLTMICGIVLSTFLIRTLGDTEYGLYQTISSFANYLVLFEFGVGTVMTRNISVCRAKGTEEELKKHVSTIWYMSLFLSAVIALVSVAFYCNIANIYSNSMTLAQVQVAKKIFIFVTLHLVLSFLLQVLDGLLLGYENYSFTKTISIIRTISKLVILLVLISFRKSAVLIAVVDAILGVIVFTTTWSYIKIKFGVHFRISSFDFSILKGATPLCIALLLQTVVNQANNNVDKFIIGICLSLESVTLYSIAQYIFGIFASMAIIPIGMYLPQVSKDISNGMKEEALTRTMSYPCRLSGMIGGIILFGFVAVGKPFIRLLYGPGYELAYYYTIILMIPSYLNLTIGTVQNVLNVLNKRMVRSLILLGTTVLNILFTILVIGRYGILGAVIVTAICTMLGPVFLVNIYYRKHLGIRVGYLYREAYRGILSFLIIGSIAGALICSYVSNALLAFVLGGFAFVIISGILIYCFGLDKSEIAKVRKFLDRKR